MPTGLIKTRLDMYRIYRDRLKAARDAEFKTRAPVRVRRDSGHDLYGLIASDEGCPLTQLAVTLENGNTWWYELEDCSSVRRDGCPPWLQRVLRKDSVVSVQKLGRHLKAQGR